MEKVLSSLLSKPAGYGVYIHWPYCSRICSYCNFNKYRQPSNSTSADHHNIIQHCFTRQLSHLLQDASQFPIVTSVYFGGGTPSLAPTSTISSILDVIQRGVGLADGAEVTLEVNPTLDVVDKLPLFRKAGVNRVSIGVQSLNDSLLEKVLYRSHTASDAKHVIAEACDVFNGVVNVDIMFGLPGQTDVECLNDVSEIIKLDSRVNHFSLYELTLERGTEMFKQVRNNKWTLPSEESVSRCYQELVQLLNKHDFVQYEISNFPCKV